MTDKKKSFPLIPIVVGGLILFGLGLGGGFMMFRAQGGGQAVVASGDEAGTGLYTCGMHPNVIQKGPGQCPICKMDLNPIKSGGGAAGSGGKKERVIKYWVAPMNPSFVSDKPGKSPMGMDLVPVYEDEVESERAVEIDPRVVQNIGVRTAEVQRGRLTKTIRATGEIVEDETQVGIINLKIAGWIDTVFVDETGQSVRKGDRLLDIYSPQLVSTQEEYLIALRNMEKLEESSSKSVVEGAKRTLASTRRRLLYWDITGAQIDALAKSGEVSKTMVLRSPFTGVVTMKNALPGQKVVPGTDLYHIADLSTIWVEASVFDADLPHIWVGQEATMDLAFMPGTTFRGKVTFISPVLNAKTRDLKIRLEFPNPDLKLKPGMYADVVIQSVISEDATLLPAEAVIHSGKRSVIFVTRGEGRFIPTDVLLGSYGQDNKVQVLAGVVPGERVVTSAQFLLDSESSFQEALRKMMEAETPELAKEIETEKKIEVAEMEQGMGDDHAGDNGNGGAWSPHFKAKFEGKPVANAVSIEPDGSITIMCPVRKGTATVKEGDPYTEYNGMRVYYCCPGCQADFEKDPEHYLAELDSAMHKAE